MNPNDEAGDKSFEPTQKKLADARKKGDVARSTDLNTTAMYLGFILAGLAFGRESFETLALALSALVGRSGEMAALLFDGRGAPLMEPMIRDLIAGLAPFVVVPMALVLASVLAQRSFVVAGEKLKPKISRISVLENAKNKFGSRGLFEFVKSAVKLGVISWVLYIYLSGRFEEIVSGVLMPAKLSIVKMTQYAMEFLAIVFVIALVIGAVDYLWQVAEHRKKQMMSHKELRDEAKETEGEPYLKQARRSKAEQIALNSMLSDVPKADVVIVNPTHYAVALKWSREARSAPECVAKGVDEIALRIRAVAQDSAVPIHSDPPTARALFATVEIGEEITPEHYKAVAAAIRFSDAMRRKARGRVT